MGTLHDLDFHVAADDASWPSLLQLPVKKQKSVKSMTSKCPYIDAPWPLTLLLLSMNTVFVFTEVPRCCRRNLF